MSYQTCRLYSGNVSNYDPGISRFRDPGTARVEQGLHIGETFSGLKIKIIPYQWIIWYHKTFKPILRDMVIAEFNENRIPNLAKIPFNFIVGKFFGQSISETLIFKFWFQLRKYYERVFMPWYHSIYWIFVHWSSTIIHLMMICLILNKFLLLKSIRTSISKMDATVNLIFICHYLKQTIFEVRIGMIILFLKKW